MSGKPLQSLRKKGGRAPQPARAARSVERIGREALIERRASCLAEIQRLSSDADDPHSFLDKARQLLTRHWWPASWRARADILRSAEWLVGVGRRGAGITDPARPEPILSRGH